MSFTPEAPRWPVASPDTAPCPVNHLPPELERMGAAMPTVRLSSRTLLGGRHEVEIDHDGVVYRLRQTSLGKLILTK